MKTFLNIISILFPLISMAQVNNTYILEGKSGKPATVTLQYIINGKTITNTGEVKNGEIKLSGTIDTKVMASLLVSPIETSTSGSGSMATMVHLWLEPGNIKINSLDSLLKGNALFTGTPLNDDSNGLAKEKMTVAGLSGKERDDAEKAVVIKFIKAHPNSLVSLTELNISLSRGIPDLKVVEPLFSSLDTGIKNSPLGMEYQKKLIKWRTVDVGSSAPDFTQPDIGGKTISLSDYKGKYVLVDFWASWCHPCRDENPNLVKQYKKYKERNFMIISISIDEIKGNWIKAVKEDKLPWIQVSDLKRRNEAYLRFGVGAIPDNFLIDPQGRIIAKSLRGEELDKKLAEVFDVK